MRKTIGGKLRLGFCAVTLALGMGMVSSAATTITGRGVSSDGYGGSIGYTNGFASNGITGQVYVGITSQGSNNYVFGYASGVGNIRAVKGYSVSPSQAKTIHGIGY